MTITFITSGCWLPLLSVLRFDCDALSWAPSMLAPELEPGVVVVVADAGELRRAVSRLEWDERCCGSLRLGVVEARPELERRH